MKNNEVITVKVNLETKKQLQQIEKEKRMDYLTYSRVFNREELKRATGARANNS